MKLLREHGPAILIFGVGIGLATYALAAPLVPPTEYPERLQALAERSHIGAARCGHFAEELRQARAGRDLDAPVQSREEALKLLTLVERFPGPGASYGDAAAMLSAGVPTGADPELVFKSVMELRPCAGIIPVYASIKALLAGGSNLKAEDWRRMKAALIKVADQETRKSNSLTGVLIAGAIAGYLQITPEFQVADSRKTLNDDYQKAVRAAQDQIRADERAPGAGTAHGHLNHTILEIRLAESLRLPIQKFLRQLKP